MTCIYRKYFSYLRKTVFIVCEFRGFLQFCITGVNATLFICSLKVPAELSETQNYAYWDANFLPGTHGFHQARVSRTHVFLVGTRQKSSS